MAYVSTLLRREFRINQLVTVHYLEYGRNLNFPGERHDFWEIVCVDKGEVEVGANDVCHLLKSGDVIFHKPMEFHSIKSHKKTAPNLLILSFVCKSKSMKYFENKILQINDEGKRLLSTIFQEAQSAFSTQLDNPRVEEVVRRSQAVFGAEQMILTCLEQFLIGLVRSSLASEENLLPLASVNVPTTGSQQLYNVRRYLQEHVEERLNVQKICNDNFIGRSYLQSLFHCYHQCGIMQYFYRLKVAHGREMLRLGEKNMARIADQLCFSSTSHFCKCFKQHTGMTPSQYVQSIKGLTESVNIGKKDGCTSFSVARPKWP